MRQLAMLVLRALVLIAVLASPVDAARISVHVSGSDPSVPLQGATVRARVNEALVSGLTDEYGSASFDFVDAPMYSVVLSMEAPGYMPRVWFSDAVELEPGTALAYGFQFSLVPDTEAKASKGRPMISFGESESVSFKNLDKKAKRSPVRSWHASGDQQARASRTIDFAHFRITEEDLAAAAPAPVIVVAKSRSVHNLAYVDPIELRWRVIGSKTAKDGETFELQEPGIYVFLDDEALELYTGSALKDDSTFDCGTAMAACWTCSEFGVADAVNCGPSKPEHTCSWTNTISSIKVVEGGVATEVTDPGLKATLQWKLSETEGVSFGVTYTSKTPFEVGACAGIQIRYRTVVRRGIRRILHEEKTYCVLYSRPGCEYLVRYTKFADDCNNPCQVTDKNGISTPCSDKKDKNGNRLPNCQIAWEPQPIPLDCPMGTGHFEQCP